MNAKLKNAKKIIIIDLLYLGDLIFTTPFLRNLRRNLPDTQIDMVVNSNFHDILVDNPYLDNVYSYNKKWSFKESISFARKMARGNYDLGLNIHGNWRTALFLMLVRPQYSIGFGSKGRGIFLNKVLKSSENAHMVDIYLKFLSDLGINNIDNYGLELEIKQEAREKMDIYLKEQGVKKGDELIGLNTGGSYETKKWPIEKFASLADKLQEQYKKKVVFFGGPTDVERVAKVIELMKTKAIVAAGKTSIKELPALAERCNLFISGDTGPLHVAASVGTPTIAIFGPTDENMFYPYGEGHQVVTVNDLPCRPCGEQICPLGHHNCLNNIEVEDILKRAEDYF